MDAELVALKDEARDTLLRARGRLEGAEDRVPNRPGLYAIFASAQTWEELSLGIPPDARPLYVGKAEDSLVTRDLKTHFGDGRTGQSTVRRSFAALLHEMLNLRGRPRNPANPGNFANYGMSPAHDAQLTRWMRDSLELSVWPKPIGCRYSLGEIESAVLTELLPPLNLQGIATPWTARLKAARAVMAEEARTASA